jgi:hypothetical protein
MLSVAMLSVVILSVAMLSVVMLRTDMLSFIMCHYAEFSSCIMSLY